MPFYSEQEVRYIPLCFFFLRSAYLLSVEIMFLNNDFKNVLACGVDFFYLARLFVSM